MLCLILITGCATGRNLTSSHYIPEWENRLIKFKSASDTSGGYWAVKTAQMASKGIGKIFVFPFALVSNIVVNTYFVATWPLRRVFMGDKRLIIWYPLFGAGNTGGSAYYSNEWNRDLV